MVSTSAFSEPLYDAAYPEGIERHFWNLARNRVILRHLRRHSDPAARVLEIGCGRGIVVDFLRKRGIDCRGCELAEIDIAPALMPWVQTGQDAFELEEQQRLGVDCLMLLDVIEHLDDPLAFLCRMLEAFPKAQRLLVTVPARPELWSNFDRYYGHQCRFTLSTLRGLISGVELREIGSSYFFHSLYLPMYLSVMVGRERSVILKPPRWSGLHFLLSTLMSAEERLLPSSLPGTSIIATFDRVGAG